MPLHLRIDPTPGFSLIAGPDSVVHSGGANRRSCPGFLPADAAEGTESQETVASFTKSIWAASSERLAFSLLAERLWVAYFPD